MTEKISPTRSESYYRQLRIGLRERFSGRGLKKLEPGAWPFRVREEELLELEETQAVLWLIGKSPEDFDEGIKAYDAGRVYSVVVALNNRGYLHRPILDKPVVLTQKGLDYLASREGE